jgi:hypothetical protein
LARCPGRDVYSSRRSRSASGRAKAERLTLGARSVRHKRSGSSVGTREANESRAVVATDRMVRFPGLIGLEHATPKMLAAPMRALVMPAGDTLVETRISPEVAGSITGTIAIVEIAQRLGRSRRRDPGPRDRTRSLRGMSRNLRPQLLTHFWRGRHTGRASGPGAGDSASRASLSAWAAERPPESAWGEPPCGFDRRSAFPVREEVRTTDNSRTEPGVARRGLREQAYGTHCGRLTRCASLDVWPTSKLTSTDSALQPPRSSGSRKGCCNEMTSTMSW